MFCCHPFEIGRYHARYGTTDGPERGYLWERRHNFTLGPTEQIVKVTGEIINDGSSFQGLLTQVIFHTNLGNTYGPYGWSSGTPFTAQGATLIAMSGRHRTTTYPSLTYVYFHFQFC